MHLHNVEGKKVKNRSNNPDCETCINFKDEWKPENEKK
jgi:hypothetical protein